RRRSGPGRPVGGVPQLGGGGSSRQPGRVGAAGGRQPGGVVDPPAGSRSQDPGETRPAPPRRLGGAVFGYGVDLGGGASASEAADPGDRSPLLRPAVAV